MKTSSEIALSNLPSRASVSLAIAALLVGIYIGSCFQTLNPVGLRDSGTPEDPHALGQVAANQLGATTTNGVSEPSAQQIERFELINDRLICGKDIVSDDASLQKTDCSFLSAYGISAYCPGSYRDVKRVYIATSNSCADQLSLDLNSLTRLSPLYFSDAHGVYFAVNGVDTNLIGQISKSTSSFQVLSAGFARDARKVYFAYNAAAKGGSPIVFDEVPESFQLINEYYATGNDRVWYIRNPHHEGFPEVHAIAADPQSLRPASPLWPEMAIDAKSVYLYGVPQIGIDAATFRIATGTSQSAVASDKLRRYQMERSVDDTRTVRLMAL